MTRFLLHWSVFVHNSLFLCTYIFYVVDQLEIRALKQSEYLLVLYLVPTGLYGHYQDGRAFLSVSGSW